MVKMTIKAWCLAAALCFLAAHATAATTASSSCTQQSTGSSAFLGLKKSGAKFVDHTPLMKRGPIRQLSLYFNKPSGCLRGAKAVFGATTPTPGMIGTSANTTETALKLKEGEYITKVDYKANKCIEYVKLYTNSGRSVYVGSASSPAKLVTSAANMTAGHLVALRGFQGVNGDKPGQLQQLQFVWGKSSCASTTADLMLETGTVSVSNVPITTSSSSSSSNGITTNHAAAAAAADTAQAFVNTNPAQCAAKLDMCNEKASMNQFSYCVWNAPFKTSACKGGCCFSSGKCASSSCAISGIGRDVANMICYGTNMGFGFGGSSLCQGLACKLANPGCTTDAFGGNCVGTVVAAGSADSVHPDSVRYIGAPCLDATPSDVTLDAAGNPAGITGIYMGKLWTICDCSDSPGDGMPPAARLLNLTTSGLSNLTKNDVLLAVSQLLPRVNLSEAVDADKSNADLFPSFTDFFKAPTLPSISLPSILTGNSSTAGHNASGTIPAIQLPDLGTLLSQLASKANSTAAAAAAAEKTAKIASVAPAATNSSSSTPTNPFAGLKDFMSKIMPGLTNSSLSSSSKSAASAPVSAAATAAPTVVLPAAGALVPESGMIAAAAPVATASVAAPTTSSAVPAASISSPAAGTPVAVAATPVAVAAAPVAVAAAPVPVAATPVAVAATPVAAATAPTPAPTTTAEPTPTVAAQPTAALPTTAAAAAPPPAAAAPAAAAPAASTSQELQDKQAAVDQGMVAVPADDNLLPLEPTPPPSPFKGFSSQQAAISNLLAMISQAQAQQPEAMGPVEEPAPAAA